MGEILHVSPMIQGGMSVPAGHAWVSYYSIGGQRVAQRVQSNQVERQSALYYFLTDHLSSTTVTLDEQGNLVAELRYDAWGETRYRYEDTPTTYRFTGQREAETGLYFYQSRFYDPQSARFIQADTLVPSPGNVLAWDRFSYVYNNPIKYTDPSGHYVLIDEDPEGLAVRTNQNGQYIIHQGGDVFVNDVEIGLANYYLTGNENYLPNVPDYGIMGSYISATSELGYTWKPGKILTDLFNFLNFSSGAIDGAYTLRIPGWVGLSMDISGQLALDEGFNFSPYQQFSRCFVVAAEGQAIRLFATMTGAGMGGAGALLVPDPTDVAAFAFGYSVTIMTGSNIAHQINAQYIFPLIQEFIP